MISEKDGKISKTFAFVFFHSTSHDEASGHIFYNQTICSEMYLKKV